MRWQTTAVLAVLLLALGGFYYLYEVRWAPAREEAASRKGRLFVADTKDVTEVVIKRAEDTVRLKRQGEDWDMLEPLRARGSRPAVDETLANLMTAKIDREIVAKPEALGEFGLDKPAAEVTLTLKSDAKGSLGKQGVAATYSAKAGKTGSAKKRKQVSGGKARVCRFAPQFLS